MKKLWFAGLVALASFSVACGGPVLEEETSTEGEQSAPPEERQVTALESCPESYTCVACVYGHRSQRTYYAKQQLVWSGTSWWLYCSDPRTEYGTCGACAE